MKNKSCSKPSMYVAFNLNVSNKYYVTSSARQAALLTRVNYVPQTQQGSTHDEKLLTICTDCVDLHTLLSDDCKCFCSTVIRHLWTMLPQAATSKVALWKPRVHGMNFEAKRTLTSIGKTSSA
eukprot:3362996-Amphidinium_carterae.1